MLGPTLNPITTKKKRKRLIQVEDWWLDRVDRFIVDLANIRIGQDSHLYLGAGNGVNESHWFSNRALVISEAMISSIP